MTKITIYIPSRDYAGQSIGPEMHKEYVRGISNDLLNYGNVYHGRIKRFYPNGQFEYITTVSIDTEWPVELVRDVGEYINGVCNNKIHDMLNELDLRTITMERDGIRFIY